MKSLQQDFLRLAVILAGLTLLLFSTSTPVTSMGTITLTGSATGSVGFFGSPNKSLITVPGQTGTSISLDSDTPSSPAQNFVGSVNFGTLGGGNGGNSIASFSMRERGNTKCHVSASVSSYTATNISYDGTALAGGDAAELTFVTLGNGPVTAGAQGNPAAHSYGAMFDGTHTLAELNSGTIAPVATGKDEFDSYSSKPSLSGTLVTANDYVEDTVTFTVPTGFVWSPTDDSGTGTFTIAVQFEIYRDP
jgi:hypothetical protein